MDPGGALRVRAGPISLQRYSQSHRLLSYWPFPAERKNVYGEPPYRTVSRGHSVWWQAVWQLLNSAVNFHAVFRKNLAKQECIPVGCVPPAHWLYLIVSARGHACHTFPPCHTYPPSHTPPAMHTPLPCTPPGTHDPMWTEFLTHASENITLPQLRCGQ